MGKIPARTQSSVAISTGRGVWLINASPDLPRQIESHPDLQPDFHSCRNSPIRGVFLTNADLDHLLGLFALREGERFQVFATEAVQSTMAKCLGLRNILDSFCGASWSEPPSDFSPVSPAEQSGTGLQFRAIRLTGSPPPFARNLISGDAHSIAYQFLDPATGGRLLVAPDVAALNAELKLAISDSTAVLFDGTFWSKDELTQVKPEARTADQMGHLTISDCTLELLRKSPARHKIFLHINNTNPILSPGSAERAAVEAAGIVVGFDGLEFEV